MSSTVVNHSKRASDEELIRRFKDGDTDSLDTLIRLYLPRVHNSVSRFVPETDVEDVTQDVFMSLLNALSSFKGRSTFSTWFHRITMNKVADYHRKALRNREDFGEIEINTSFNPWNETDENLTIEEVLKGIPDKYKQIITLKFSKGLTFSEISEILGLSYEATRSRYRRAIALARKRLKKSSNVLRK